VSAIGAVTALSTSIAQSASAAQRPVALWHMDDKTTTIRDASGHAYTATVHNVQLGQPGWAGTSFGFATTPAYVRIGSAPALNPGTRPFTVTVRVRFASRPSASVEDYDIIRKGLSSTPGGSFKMEILGSGKAFCDFRGSREVSVTNGPNLADSRWHTVTCRRNRDSVALVVDGRSYTRSGSTGSISNSDAVFLGAKDASGADQYAGLLDEVSIVRG
jgi:Concanavalin A-like lectin/glucanases superfamily